jgi:Pyruvate/2-oxoacid:ferredoxin oxidoreductase delta subunit/flavodoxin
MYNDLIIYYFSGTGNALTASRWIGEYAQKQGIETNLVSIDRLKEINVPPAKGKRMIGFCYPTHGFNLPWIMLKFILRFPTMKKCDVFLLNTRAGSKIYKWFPTGISGIAQALPAIILLLKGFRIRGMLPLDMPSNWITLHPGFSQTTIAAIFARCRTMVDGFCKKTLSGQLYIRPNVLIMLPIDLALAPIALGYSMYGRFYLAKIFIASTDCDTCRLCENKCPTASIKIIDKRPFWKLTCESCMRCINICPHKAIQVSHSLAVIILVVSSYISIAFSLYLFNPFVPTLSINTPNFLIQWGISIFKYFIVSGFVFWLIRIKLLNNLFTYTSLTKYWRRYIAEGISVKDF